MNLFFVIHRRKICLTNVKLLPPPLCNVILSPFSIPVVILLHMCTSYMSCFIHFSIDELVKHDQNGLLFNDANDLSTQIQVHLRNTYV